mgnify:CR=1 FL=1
MPVFKGGIRSLTCVRCFTCCFFTKLRNVSITFFMRGVQRFSFMFSSRNFLIPSSSVSWHSVRRMQCIEPYWSTIWFRNWRIGRWVFMKGVHGFGTVPAFGVEVV